MQFWQLDSTNIEDRCGHMKNRKIGIIAGLGVIAIIVVIVIIGKNIKAGNELKAEVEQGVSVVKQLETASVAEIESKISLAEAEKALAESIANAASGQEVSLLDRFANANAVVIGDSQALALSVYNILSTSNVLAKISQHAKDSDEYINNAISLNASYVFMTYGMNDLGIYSNGTQFADAYGAQLEKIRQGLPNAQVFVTSIFPAQQSAINKQPWLNADNLNDFNTALKAKTEELGMVYIDCNNLVEEQYYEPDGEHFTKSFYSTWARTMADTAGF